MIVIWYSIKLFLLKPVPPYPSLMKPSAPLLHTRLINAAIQAFSQLFVYSGSGSRGKMTEVVLNNMSNGLG